VSTDFTVVIRVRQSFGDGTTDWDEILVETLGPGAAPFVGTSAEYEFTCPNVRRGADALIQFESIGVHPLGRAGLSINGIEIYGGITGGPRLEIADPAAPSWKSHNLIIGPNTLQEQNVLRIESAPTPVINEPGGWDNFIVDNVVVIFKTQDEVGLAAAEQHTRTRE